MNPARFSQMMKYLTRAKKEKPDLPDVFPASKAPIPSKTQNVEEIEAINRFMRANPRTEKAGGGRIGLSKGKSPKAQEALDLITPVRQKYINLKEAQINDPKGGTLKNFLNYENFLIKEIDSVKNTADAKKLISRTQYYLDPPEKLTTSRKKLLDNLIKIENEMPGKATPGYKLALQAGYVMKKTTKGSKTTTAPPGSFKNLLTVNDKKINRIDEVIKQLDAGQIPLDDIIEEGSLTRYINKPFGFKDPESFNQLIRTNKKYKDRLNEFKLLNNQSFLGKYKGRGLLANEAQTVFEQGRTGGANFSRSSQRGPLQKIFEFADRHIERDGKLIRKIDDNTFIYNNKIFSRSPGDVDQRALKKLGLENKKIIDLVLEGPKRPEFKEIFDAFDKQREYETIVRAHPVTGKKTPLTQLLQEADYIAGGRDRLTSKNIFSRIPFEIDHFGSVKNEPFKNVRVIPRTINQAAGQFQKGTSTFKNIKQAEDFIGYSFTGDPLKSINQYINTEIQRGQNPNYTGRPKKIASAKTKAIDTAAAKLGQRGTRGGTILTQEIPSDIFTESKSASRDKNLAKTYTSVPILEKTKGGKLTVGSRPITEKEIISVAERDAMEKNILAKIQSYSKKTECRVNLKADGGRIGFANSITCIQDGLKEQKIAAQNGNKKAARELVQVGKVASRGKLLKNILGPGAILGEAVFEGGLIGNKVLGGKPADIAWAESYLSYLDPRKYRGELDPLKMEREDMLTREVEDADGNIKTINAPGFSALKSGFEAQDQLSAFNEAVEDRDIAKARNRIDQYLPAAADAREQGARADQSANIISSDSFKDASRLAQEYLQGQTGANMAKYRTDDFGRFESGRDKDLRRRRMQEMSNQMPRDFLTEKTSDLLNRTQYLRSLGFDVSTRDLMAEQDMLRSIPLSKAAEIYSPEQVYGTQGKFAGGGIAKLAGVSSGPPPESGPNSQGLLSLKNRVRNY